MHHTPELAQAAKQAADDLRDRTFNGTVFDTVLLAQQARQT
jgi:hypothetical protein